MSLKTQVKALLKSKYPGVQLSNERVDSIAAFVDGKTTEEADVEGILEQMNEFNPFADIAKQDDRIRTLEAATKKPTSVETPAPAPTPDPSKSDDPMALILAELKGLKGEMAAIKGEKTVTTYRTKASEMLKGAPDAYLNDVLEDIAEIQFKDEDHFNTYMGRKVKAVEGLQEVTLNNSFGKDKPVGGLGGKQSKEASSKELDAAMEHIKI